MSTGGEMDSNPVERSAQSPTRISFWARLSFRHKLIAGIVAVSSSVVLVAGFSFIVYVWIAFRHQMVSELSVQTRMLGQNCNSSLTFDSPSDAQEVLESVPDDQAITFVVIYDNEGNGFASYWRDKEGAIRYPELPETMGHRFEANHLVMFRPILLDGRRIGTIGVQKDLIELREFINTSISAMAALLLMLSLLAYLMASGLQRIIFAPIHQLAKTAKSVSVEHDYSVRARKVSEDELGLFTDAFNEMLEQIDTRETERDLAEQSLRSSEEQISMLLNSTAESIYGLDLKGNCTWCNPACLEMLGYDSSTQLIGKNMHELIHHSHADGSPYPKSDCRIYKAFRTGTRTHVDDEVLWRADGTCLNVEYRSYPIVQGGKSIGAVVTFLDITEKLEAEFNKTRLEEQLMQAQKMESLGTLAGGIAHDFNNILHAILGFTKHALNNAGDEAEIVRRCLERINEGGQRASDLVAQILTFSRKSAVVIEPLNLHPHIEDSIKFIRSSIPTTIEIESDIDPQCGEVGANSTQIHQVVTNLCTNAMHAMENSSRGQLSITLEPLVTTKIMETLTVALEPGDYVQLSVTDTGTGIEPEKINRVVDPFFTTKEAGKGTGLGLAMVHGIVTNMGGGMIIESVLGQGTKIRVIVPLWKAIHFSKEMPIPGNTKVNTGTGHVLLVDDEEPITMLAGMLLEHRGFTTEAYNDVDEALEAIEKGENSYNFAIFDFTMPKMTGLELAEKVYAHDPEIPIFLATGLLDEKKLNRSISPNVVEIIKKPFDIDDLMNSFNRLLRA